MDLATASDPQTTASSTEEIILAISALLLLNEDEGDLLDPVAELLASLRIPRAAVRLVLRIAMSVTLWAPTNSVRPDGAVDTIHELASFYRSAFIVESGKRIASAIARGENIEDIRRRENTYFRQHLDAMSNRRAVAIDIDNIAKRLNTATLGWYSVRDNRTSVECRQAHGKNFDIGSMPIIGYPGMVHPSCRCKAGPPHRGATRLRAVA